MQVVMLHKKFASKTAEIGYFDEMRRTTSVRAPPNKKTQGRPLGYEPFRPLCCDASLR
jgi:hypothetical protein